MPVFLRAIRYCLEAENLRLDELDRIVFYDKPLSNLNDCSRRTELCAEWISIFRRGDAAPAQGEAHQ